MENKKPNLPDCCKPAKESSGLAKGIMYGTIPHLGCIAFVLASIAGVGFAASIFKPLLAKAYFFYIMILLSLFFATISAFFYLRKQGGVKEAMNHKKYLAILYGSTVAVSLVLYFFIFPLVSANIASTGTSIATDAELTLSVDIPCSGHAALITGELQTIPGITKIDYQPMKTFRVYYNPSIASKEKILELAIFKEYRATPLN